MRLHGFAALLLPAVLAACGSDERRDVIVQPTAPPTVVTAPAQPVVVSPPPTDVTVTHAVVSSYGGTIHMRPDPQSAVVTTLPPSVRVAVIGSANEGTWAHVVGSNGVDGYMPRTELQ
jgi:Bacterial SH3 domain